MLNAVPDAGWGLHLVDANIALGNLTAVVKRQIKAYLKAERLAQIDGGLGSGGSGGPGSGTGGPGSGSGGEGAGAGGPGVSRAHRAPPYPLERRQFPDARDRQAEARMSPLRRGALAHPQQVPAMRQALLGEPVLRRARPAVLTTDPPAGGGR